MSLLLYSKVLTDRCIRSEERVDAWYNAIPAGTEACHNLMRLCLDIQFFWLGKGNHTSEVGILQRPTLPVDLNQGPNVTMLYNVQTRKEVCSADQISLETDGPVAHPLSDFRLLEMQWFLNRVVAMSGATETQDDFGDDSDDGLPMALQKRWNLYTEDE